MERKTYYEDDNFKVILEKLEGQMYIHVGIFQITKAVLKDIKRVWAEAVVEIWLDGYENLFTYTKDNRIVKLIGGAKKVGQHENIEVWQWDLS